MLYYQCKIGVYILGDNLGMYILGEYLRGVKKGVYILGDNLRGVKERIIQNKSNILIMYIFLY